MRLIFHILIAVLAVPMASFAKEISPSVYFTSKQDLAQQFLLQVKKETVSIRLAAHRLSDAKVVRALIEAHRRGVVVEVIVDPITRTSKSPVSLLEKEGIPVFVYKGVKDKKKTQRMHHMFCVFGEEICWTGSYSFSVKRSFLHRESAVVLHDRVLAQEFLTEFDEIKTECTESRR